jgi:hypothetical protein
LDLYRWSIIHTILSNADAITDHQIIQSFAETIMGENYKGMCDLSKPYPWEGSIPERRIISHGALRSCDHTLGIIACTGPLLVEMVATSF